MEAIYGHRRTRERSRLGYGLYLRGESASLVDELRAWSLVLPARAAFTHLTATQLRGWWQPGTVEHPIFVAARRGVGYPQRPELAVSRLKQWPSAQVVGGVRVVSPAESLLACARDLGLIDLVQLGDCALRLEHCSLDDIAAVAAQSRPGVARLRQLIPLLDARSESPWESVMRLLHQAADIPVEPQHKFYDARGRFVARADLWIVGTNRIHEYDGADHRGRESHRSDLRRDRALVDLGVDRCGYTAAELLYEGGSIIASADRLLCRRWDPVRLRRWNGLVADSLFGRARLGWSKTSAGRLRSSTA